MPKRYTVKKGDSWFRIAGSIWGNQRYAQRLAEANGAYSGGQWGKLTPGMSITIPDLSTGEQGTPPVISPEAVGIPQPTQARPGARRAEEGFGTATVPPAPARPIQAPVQAQGRAQGAQAPGAGLRGAARAEEEFYKAPPAGTFAPGTGPTHEDVQRAASLVFGSGDPEMFRELMDAPDAEVIQAIQERLASDTRYLDTLRETEQRRAAMQQSYTTGVPHDLSTNPPPRLNPEQIDMYNAATPSMLLRFAAEGDQQAAALYMAQFGQAQRAMFPLTTTFEGQLRAATQYADPEMLGLQPGVHYGEADIPTPIRLNVIQQHFIWRDTLRNRLFTSIEQTMPTIGRPLLDLQAWVAGNGAVQAMSTFGPSLGASIYYGPQLLNLASKIPEDLVFLAQLYGPQYVGTPGAEGTAYGFYQGMEFGAPVTQHPMYALSDAEKAQYAKLQSDALEVQRQHREDFELFIRHGDPRGPIESVIVHGRGGGVVQERRRDSVDWSRVFGRVTFSPEPGLEGWTNALITSQGIAGLGATFTLHPERFDQFINDVARGDALGPEAGHQAYIAAMIKYEDIYAEMAVQIVSDPLNFAGPLGNIITKVLFPPAILFEPVLKGVLGRIVSPRRLQAGQATVAGIEEYMSSTSFFYRIAKRQLHSHAVDATIDSLNTLLLNYNPLLDGDGLTFWRRVLLGDTDWLTSKGLGRGQIDQILDLARLFKEHKLADLTDVFTSNRAMRSGIWTETVASLAEQEGLDLADPAAKEMLAEIVTRYARNDPHNLKTVFAQVYSELMRRRLGLRTYPRGSVARFFLTSGQLLKEQWLMLSIKFWTANGLSNVSNALAAGYVINPFDLGAATRIAEIFERSYRIGMPNEVMRSFWMDALEGGEGHLLSSLVPIPGYGEMSKAIPATLEFLGAQVPKRLTEFLGTEPALLRALDKINVSRLMQAGGDLSSAVERTARAQIFIKAFTDELEIRIRPQIAAELAQDAAAPSSLVEGVRLGTIRNVSDIEDDFRANYINNRRPMHRISLMRPEGIDAYNSHIETLTRRLDEIQAKYIDAYDNPLFRQEVRDAYANAQVALGRDFEALNDFLRQQVPDFERFDRMMQEGMGVTPKAHPAPLEHYENRLRWLKERDQAATAARGVGGAAAPVSPAPQITPTEVAPRPFQAGRRPVQVRDAITGRQGGEVLSEALGRTPVRRLEGETGHAYLLRRYGSVEAANDALERLGFSVDDFGGLGGSAYDDIAQWLQGHDSTILKGTYVPGSTGINYTRGIHIPEAPPGVVAEPASSIYFTQLDAGRIQINSETRITREGVAEFGERLARDGAPLDTKVRITPRRLAQEFGAEELTLRDIIGEEAAQRIEGVTPPSAAAEIRTPGGTVLRAGRQPNDGVAALRGLSRGEATAWAGDFPAWQLSQRWDEGYNQVKGVFMVPPEGGEPRWYFAKVDGSRYFHENVAYEIAQGNQELYRPLAYYTSGYGANPSVVLSGADANAVFGDLIREGLDPTAKLNVEGYKGISRIDVTVAQYLGGEEWLDNPLLVSRAGGQLATGLDDATLKRYGIRIATKGKQDRLFTRRMFTSNEPVLFVADLDGGRIGYARGAGIQNDHNKLWQGMGMERGAGGLWGMTSPDGRIIFGGSPLDVNFDNIQRFAALLKEQGAPNNAVMYTMMAPQDEWFGPLYLTVGEAINGKVDPAAMTLAEAFVAEESTAQHWANLRTEVRDSYRKSLRDIDLWQTAVSKRIDDGIEVIKLNRVDMDAARAYYDSFKSRWGQSVESATYIAAQKVHEILFDYASRGNIEGILRFISPFTTWQLRNPMFWAQAFMDHPNMLGIAIRAWRASEIERKRKNLTERFQGTFGITTPGGGYLAADVRFSVPVFSQIQEPYEPIGYEGPQESWQKIIAAIVNAGGWIGVRPWPWVEYALQRMGVMPDRDLLRGLFGPLHRLIETIAWQQGWIMPWENLVTGTTDPGTYNMWMYSIHRRIDELEAEGTITHEEALNAFDNPENETFQQAFQEVVQRESIKSYVSLAAPTPLKYATPGEVEIREQLAEREATAEFYRPQYNETHPALRNYSRLFLTPEERQTDIERERLFTELGALGRDEEALARRTEIFAALEETTPPKYMWSRPGYLAASLGSMQPESEGDVLRWLNALEPTANEFKDEEGEIDWDAYDRAIETFRNRIIPDLSERWGFPVTEERFDQAEARYKTGIEVAFELNQERVSEGFRRLEMLQPGGTDFPAAARQFISAQYEADILAGMDPEVAAARGVDTFEYISVNGLPFEIEQEILGKYIRELPAEAFATQVLQRIGIDIGQNPETLMGMRTSLAQTGEQMRGMFTPQNEGDRARDELSTYYYSLSPGGRNALRDMLNIPEDIETFGRWVQDMSDEDVVAVAKTATALLPRAQSAVMDIHSSLTRLFGVPVETLIPLLSPLTAGERVQLEQAERDMFEYNYSQEYLDTPGEWTSLMDKYFGDPTSPKNEFWEELGRYALSTNAFDDPVLGAFLNAAVREGLDFSEAQYKWALDWFRQNRNLYIDPELTADIRDHPEWVRLGDTSRQYLRGMQSLRMEERKRVYFLIPDRRPSRGVPSPREEWERDHAEEYRQIVRYMNEQEARRVGEPHYLYFFYPRDYKRWFGERDPDEVEASGAADRISELWLQALEDMDAWREGSGEWTYAMEVLIGPNPGDVEGGSSGGGGGGGSSGGGEPPGPPGIPTPGPFPSP